MRLFSRLFGEKKQPTKRGTPDEVNYVLNINARLQPIHRGDLFEDLLDERLNALQIGYVTGGGTMTQEDGEIVGCDIEITMVNNSQSVMKKLRALLEALPLPKGSSLRAEDEELYELGMLEGLALYLNGTELADEVYEMYKINFVISELEDMLGSMGGMYSYWEGQEDTALYFYGDSFQQMRERMSYFLEEYPLCEKCKVVRIA